MSLITIQDSLRQSVEAASGGAQTVLVTPKGQLTYMNVIDKFDMSTIDPSLSGTHPAFIVNGVEKSKIYIGTYQGVIKNGEFISQPNQNIGTSDIPLSTLKTVITACGAGHHIMTAAEYGMVAMLASKNTEHVLGNTYFGRSGLDASQFGRRADGLSASAGITTGNPRILTGSGPVKFRHNLRYNGISDLVGNGLEFCTGLRLVADELQFLVNNNAAATSDWFDTASWKALDGATGEFVDVGSANSVKFAITSTPANAKPYSLIATSFISSLSALTNNSQTPISIAALNKLKAFGLFAVSSSALTLGLLTIPSNLSGTTYPVVGGSTSDTAAGIYQKTFAGWTSQNAQSARPCYYAP